MNMIDIVLIIVIAVAVFFTALGIVTKVEDDGDGLVTKLASLGISIVLWVSAALGSITIDIPYAFISQENALENVYHVVEGVHSFQGTEPGVAWSFILIAIMLVLVTFYTVIRETNVFERKSD